MDINLYIPHGTYAKGKKHTKQFYSAFNDLIVNLYRVVLL